MITLQISSLAKLNKLPGLHEEMFNCNPTKSCLYDPQKACNSFCFSPGCRIIIILWPWFQPRHFLRWHVELRWKSKNRDICKIWYWYIYSVRACQAATRKLNAVPVKTVTAPQLTINITVFLKPYPLTRWWTPTISGRGGSSSLSLNPTPSRNPMTNNIPETSIFQPKTELYPVFTLLRWIDRRRKRSETALDSFPETENFWQDVRVTETIALVEDWSNCWKPGAMDRVFPFVTNCNCN